MQSCETVLAIVQKVKFFLDPVKTKTKFHITIGHQTAVGIAHFFSHLNEEEMKQIEFNKNSLKNQTNKFDFNYNAQY